MNELTPDIYLSLNNYKESYEFYKSNQKTTNIHKLKIIEGLWRPDIENHKRVA